MKIGFQLSSLKKFIQTPDGVLDTFQKLRAIGYKWLQIQWVGEKVPHESVRDSLDKSGLICTGTMDAYEEIAADIDGIITRNKLWRGEYACASVGVTGDTDADAIKKLAAGLNNMAEKFSAAGMKFEIHPLFAAYAAGPDGTTPLERLWPLLDKRVLLQTDFYHIVRGGADPAGVVEKYSGRIAEAHFKDFKSLDPSLDMRQSHSFDPLVQGKFPVTPVGKGIVPWPEIIRACLKLGVKYCFAEQEAWDEGEEPFGLMRESFEYLISQGLDS